MTDSSSGTSTDGSPCVVVGLGNIGGAIATRAAESGAHVVGVDLVPELRDAFVEATGAEAVESLDRAPLHDGARVLIVVRMAHQAEDVLARLAALGRRLTAFVVTTLDLATAQGIGRHGTEDLAVVELPVSGGRGGALAGTLTLMAAGPLSADDRSFLLRHVGAHLVAFDHYGEPTAAKLHNNLLAAYHARAHAEVVAAAAARGIDPARLTEVLDRSSGESWMGRNLAVIVDDLLDKDVALYEESYGPAPAVAVGAGSGLADALADARRLLPTEP